MSLKRQQYQVISLALRATRDQVHYNKTWQHVYEQYGIGIPQGRVLQLSAKDRADLRAIVLKETGGDPISEEGRALRSESRISAAGRFRNEKWAGRGVSQGLVRLSSTSGVVRTNTDYSVPTGGYVVMPWEAVIHHQHQAVVVIENLEPFLVAARPNAVRWPRVLEGQDLLLLYRGDTQACPAAVKALLGGLAQHSAPRYAFCDFDPAGVQIAMTMPGVSGLMIPDTDQIGLQELKSATRPEVFRQQYDTVDMLQKSENTNQFLTWLPQMLKEEWAIMQEKMISLEMPLRLDGPSL